MSTVLHPTKVTAESAEIPLQPISKTHRKSSSSGMKSFSGL